VTPREVNDRLVHDVAMRTADAVLAALAVPPDGYADSHRLVYERVRDGLTVYLLRRHRELARLAGASRAGDPS
jgi:hypothetical protein